MIWLTWRQFRVQALTAAAALVAVAILLGVTGPHLASLYAASGLAGCQGDSCANAANAFLSQLQTGALDHVVYPLGLVLILATPAILGIFWGAPLIAREFEAGTYRLAWNQSVTRNRWLTVKLALTGLAAMAVTEAFSLMHAWWADPISKAISARRRRVGVQREPVQLATFASHGITPLGYAAFAFTLGTAAGALIRRAVPAMAVTLVIFALARPHAAVGPPEHHPAGPDDRHDRGCAGELRRPHRLRRPRSAWRLGRLQLRHQRGGAACHRGAGLLPVLPRSAAKYNSETPGSAWTNWASGRSSTTSPPTATGPSS